MQAWLSTELTSGKIRCDACSHFCVLGDGEIGKCGVRVVENGNLILKTYALISSLAVDPIEKKPLYHFLPNSKILSIGTVGCNFVCGFCQNHEISQYPKEHNGAILGKTLMPKEVVALAVQNRTPSIAFTYNEPTIYFEYVYDVMTEAKKHGLKNVFVTSGYESKSVLQKSVGLVDAMNIDLKAFNDKFYRDICGARLKPVLKCIEEAYKNGVWIEITVLVIEGQNDSDKEIGELCRFVAGIDPEIPLHFSAFYGAYKIKNIPRTKHSTLIRAYEIAETAGLKHVYIGNVMDVKRQSTYCSSCKEVLINRSGHDVQTFFDKPSFCRCGKRLVGVF